MPMNTVLIQSKLSYVISDFLTAKKYEMVEVNWISYVFYNSFQNIRNVNHKFTIG